MSGEAPAPEATGRVDLRVVSGRPDAEELAAVTAVLLALEAESARATTTTPRRPAPTSAWTRTARRGRSPLTPGPGAWRSFSG